MKFSANLGYLWTELSLPDAIRAAKRAGFDAVECHWPYTTPASEVLSALEETGLRMLSLNTVRGNVSAGENGLSALPGREAEARKAIDQAIDYALAINTPNIHVIAGSTTGKSAHNIFLENLRYATASTKNLNITILIEPLNHYDAPGYFLKTSGQAQNIIEEVNADNLKLMFDCYHLQIMEGDISRRLKVLHPIIGHIQIASVPDRAEPDTGELNYEHIFRLLKSLNYHAPIGAEYRPTDRIDENLGWLQKFKAHSSEITGA
ncbi:MAG: hydroxypyruvate isomerase [Parasphingorhabdus sp.]|jgi:hydroxypyruvate isomerase